MKLSDDLLDAPREEPVLLFFRGRKGASLRRKNGTWVSVDTEDRFAVGRWVVPGDEEISDLAHDIYMKHDGWWATVGSRKPFAFPPDAWCALPWPKESAE